MKRSAACARDSDSEEDCDKTKSKQHKKSKTDSSLSSWKHGLMQSMSDPNLVVFKDDQVVVIKDKYPKAKYHFLVLPIEDISSLVKITKDNLPLLKHMDSVGRSVVENYKNFKFRYGFHALPSMSRLHLHVISQDFDSPCLKTKKHWNSFTTKFFIDSDDILKQLEENGKISIMDGKSAEALMKLDLKCHQCNMTISTIPKLKLHLTKCSAAAKE